MKSALFFSLFIACVLAAQTDDRTIEGRVTNSATGAGIGGVEITVRRINESIIQHVQTDDRGDFRVTQIPDGQYGISFERTGFFPSAEGHPDRLVQIHGNSTAQINIELSPWASIRGRVVKPTGEPAPKVVVQTGPLPFPVTAVTGEDGDFLFQRLQPGSYTLLAKPAAPANVVASDGTEFVATYFRSTVDPVQAAEIVVRPGDELSGYEIPLQSAQVNRVSGTILDSAGKPVPQATVRLFSIAGVTQMISGAYLELPVEESGTKSADDGSFELASVRSGNWRVVAESATWNQVQRRDSMASGAQEIVGGRDIKDLEIRLETTIPVRVLIDAGDSPTAKPSSVPDVMLVPIDGQPDATGEGAIMASASFELLAGHYHVMRAQLAKGGYYLAAALLGSTDVLDQDVPFSAGSPPLRLIYKTDGGSLRGTVEGGDGASVMLVYQTLSGLKMAEVVPCGPGGTYDIPVVPPGNYFAAAFAQPNPGSSAPVFLSTLATRGTRVRIDSGAIVDLDLRLTKF